MPYYGKQAELNHLMQQWTEAISRHTEFRQQMDPQHRDFTQADPSGYSPAALVYCDFIQRLSHTTPKTRINSRVHQPQSSRLTQTPVPHSLPLSLSNRSRF